LNREQNVQNSINIQSKKFLKIPKKVAVAGADVNKVIGAASGIKESTEATPKMPSRACLVMVYKKN
jgi:hypothetical protein